MAGKKQDRKTKRPKTLVEFEQDFPDIWKAYARLREACDHQGGLELKTQELVKIGVEAALGRRGGLIAHIHRAQKAGATREEIFHAFLIVLPLIGLPAVLDAYLVAKDALR